MTLYTKLRQKNKSPFKTIAERIGVTESYVRKILSGERNGTIHQDGKGKEIIELAKRLINK